MSDERTPLMEAVDEADAWLNSHRVTDTWRTMNRVRDELVRAAGSPSAHGESTTKRTPDPEAPKEGDLRISYVPQIPMPAFTRQVPDLPTAQLLIDTICSFSLFEYEHKVKPDYADLADIERYESDGEGGFDWYSLDDYEIAEMSANS